MNISNKLLLSAKFIAEKITIQLGLLGAKTLKDLISSLMYL